MAPSNFYLTPGTHSADEIIRSVKQGFYVTELIGFGVNMVTGDYSRGATGLWIENGELSYPVEEVTIAGNLKEMLQNIEMVGADLEMRGRIAPTIKISQMTVAGISSIKGLKMRIEDCDPPSSLLDLRFFQSTLNPACNTARKKSSM